MTFKWKMPPPVLTPEEEERYARAVGRPTKYPQDPDEELKLISDVTAMGEKGWSITQIAVHLKVETPTLYNWAKRYPLFHKALRDAKRARIALYQRFHAETSEGVAKGNATLIATYLANNREDDMSEHFADPSKRTIGVDDSAKDVLGSIVGGFAAQGGGLNLKSDPLSDDEDDDDE